jgi:hypothetical protein
MFPPYVSVHIYDRLQGAREQYFVQLLSWIPLMYFRCVFVRPYVITVSNINSSIRMIEPT